MEAPRNLYLIHIPFIESLPGANHPTALWKLELSLTYRYEVQRYQVCCPRTLIGGSQGLNPCQFWFQNPLTTLLGCLLSAFKSSLSLFFIPQPVCHHLLFILPWKDLICVSHSTTSLGQALVVCLSCWTCFLAVFFLTWDLLLCTTPRWLFLFHHYIKPYRLSRLIEWNWEPTIFYLVCFMILHTDWTLK